MNKYFILPYKKGSKSAKALANSLGCRRLRVENSTYKSYAHHLIINWGSSVLPPNLAQAEVLNPPCQVADAVNKLTAFRNLKGHVNIPPYTTDPEIARDWLENSKTVVCRKVLNGHSGEGIVIRGPEDDKELPLAPLYTQYIKKASEFRIHVAFDKIITKQRKARKLDVPAENVNWKVRNLAGGFIFARNEEQEIPQCVLDAAKVAVKTLLLDFGSVDIIYNAHEDKAYVLEVNTACGLEGTTLDDYTRAFKEFNEQK